MNDLMALLASPGATPGGPSLPGLALGRDDAGFDAVLDQVVAQLASLLMPGAPAFTPDTPAGTVAIGLAGFAPGNADESGEIVADPTNLGAPNVTGVPAPAEDTAAPDAPVDIQAAVLAAVRAGLGLPTTNSVPTTTTTPPTTTKAMPDQAVAVGRTGVMPTLPGHAQATLPMPTGIARRFPTLPAPSLPPVDSTTTPPATTTPTPVDTASVLPDGWEPIPTAGDVDLPVVPDGFAPSNTPLNPAISDSGVVAVAQNVMVDDVATEVVMQVATPDEVSMPTSVDTAAEPVNDISVPDAPLSGVEVAEKPADGAPVPVPRFDETPPTNEERLGAIAPPTVSLADDAVDKNDTTDTLVTPHDDAPPQAAAAVTHSSDVSRAARTDRPEHANGIAAPLRAAIRERSNPKRDDSFELTIRLDPPELGAVRVRVMTQGDQVRISLHSDSPEARAVLQERRDDVKTILQNEGFNLDGFDVEGDDNRRHSPEQSQRRRQDQPAPEFVAPSLEDDGALRL